MANTTLTMMQFHSADCILEYPVLLSRRKLQLQILVPKKPLFHKTGRGISLYSKDLEECNGYLMWYKVVTRRKFERIMAKVLR